MLPVAIWTNSFSDMDTTSIAPGKSAASVMNKISSGKPNIWWCSEIGFGGVLARIIRSLNRNLLSLLSKKHIAKCSVGSLKSIKSPPRKSLMNWRGKKLIKLLDLWYEKFRIWPAKKSRGNSIIVTSFWKFLGIF